jgi:hypothetical protein
MIQICDICEICPWDAPRRRTRAKLPTSWHKPQSAHFAHTSSERHDKAVLIHRPWDRVQFGHHRASHRCLLSRAHVHNTSYGYCGNIPFLQAQVAAQPRSALHGCAPAPLSRQGDARACRRAAVVHPSSLRRIRPCRPPRRHERRPSCWSGKQERASTLARLTHYVGGDVHSRLTI